MNKSKRRVVARVRRVRLKKKKSPAEDLLKMLQTLAASGLSLEQIQALSGGKSNESTVARTNRKNQSAIAQLRIDSLNLGVSSVTAYITKRISISALDFKQYRKLSRTPKLI